MTSPSSKFAKILSVLFAAFLWGTLAGKAMATSDSVLEMSTTDGSTIFEMQNSNAVQVASVTSLGDGLFHNYVNTYVKGSAPTSLTTSPTMTAFAVPGTQFAINAGERWAFEFNIVAKVSSTGGATFGINGPTSMTVQASAVGSLATVAGLTAGLIQATNTASVLFLTINNADGFVRISGIADNTLGASGTVQLQGAVGTAARTLTVELGSFVIARKMSN